MDNPSKNFVGIDPHKAILQVCMLDGDDNILEEHRFRSGSLMEGVARVELDGSVERWRT